MTKNEYLNFIKTRGPVGTWDLKACRAADELIKRESLKNLIEKTRGWPQSKALSDFVILMVKCHFGSVEVDELLESLKCYPEWMDRS